MKYKVTTRHMAMIFDDYEAASEAEAIEKAKRRFTGTSRYGLYGSCNIDIEKGEIVSVELCRLNTESTPQKN